MFYSSGLKAREMKKKKKMMMSEKCSYVNIYRAPPPTKWLKG